jgi:hypothetical protein
MLFDGGAGTGTNAFGGNVTMNGGAGKGTGSGGAFELNGGSLVGTGNGGGFTLTGGAASAGTGGDFQILAGGGAVSGTIYVGTDANPSCFTITEDGSANSQMGFFNATPVVQQTSAPVATDLATVITLANALRTALLNLGLIA